MSGKWARVKSTGQLTRKGRSQKSELYQCDCRIRTDQASPSKPSRPARAYLRVKEQSYLDQLDTKVKQTTFQDAKNTTKDPCLLGPPSLSFAPYQKIPGSRVRHDGRAGTIDQDPEFIDFLQSLTEPATRPTAAVEEEVKKGKVTTTPLVQYIKEKKANKAKEAAAAKTAKAGGKSEAKDVKSEKPGPKVSVIKATSSPEKTRKEKATQDAIKAINKTVATMAGKGTPPKADTTAATAKASSTPQPPAKRERERGNASVAARILQRELGLSPKERRAGGTAKPSTVPPDSAKNATPVARVNLLGPSSPDTAPQQATTTPAQTQPAAGKPTPPTGPRNAKPPPAAAPPPSKPVPAPVQRPPKPNPQPSPNATSAFLKHANPSQGVTEELLEAAFSEYGAVTRCEIDKKKGFGYVDFTKPEGLKKAMQASPIKVGNGQVVVLENKPKPPVRPTVSQAPTATQQNKNQHSQAPAQPAAQTQDKPFKGAPATAPASTSTPAANAGPVPPPTAPRNANVHIRGGRGGPMGPGRGGFGLPNRGRGGFRGRGAFFPNQNHGGGQAGPDAPVTESANTTTAANPAPVAAQPVSQSTETK